MIIKACYFKSNSDLIFVYNLSDKSCIGFAILYSLVYPAKMARKEIFIYEAVPLQ